MDLAAGVTLRWREEIVLGRHKERSGHRGDGYRPRRRDPGLAGFDLGEERADH
jgi:hypothetical protein